MRFPASPIASPGPSPPQAAYNLHTLAESPGSAAERALVDRVAGDGLRQHRLAVWVIARHDGQVGGGETGDAAVGRLEEAVRRLGDADRRGGRGAGSVIRTLTVLPGRWRPMTRSGSIRCRCCGPG